jgi:hypothetical protein
MLANALRGGFRVILAVSVFYVPGVLAQPATLVPAAPLPSQVLAARKVFVSNGESTIATGVPNLVYDEFYAGLKNWGKYELVSTPAEADVVFELRFVFPTSAPVDQELRLQILDPRTHIILWPLMEHVKTANRDSTARRNFDDAMGALINDVKKLVTPSDAATPK